MEHIGALLRERRLELGLTLEEVSKRTRLQIPFIRAIEAGNIEFFKDDLSYLSYYVRHYATELGIDYDIYKTEIDDLVYDYTESLDVGEIRRNIEISDRIRKQSETAKENNKKQTNRIKPVKRTRRIDFSMIAFLVSALAVVIVLVIVLFHYVPIWLQDDPVPQPNPVEPGGNNGGDIDGDTNGNGSEGNGEETPTPGTLSLKAVDDTNFVISGWTENQSVDISLTVKNRTWIRITVDDKDVDNPVSKIYESGEVIHLSEIAAEGKIVMFHIGYVNGNTLSVGDTSVPLVDSIANLQGSVKIYFKFTNDGGSE